jgi:O-antigen/teichoic acid export membrane protein
VLLSIFKNSSWLLFAQSLIKIISFIYTIFLARTLGVEDFGYLVAALAYFSVFSSIADFGFNRYLIREGSKDTTQLSTYLSSTLLLRLVVTCGLFASFSVILYLIDSDKLRVNLSLLAVLAVIPQSIAQTFDGVLVALEKLKLSAIGLLSLSITTTFLGIYLVSNGYSTYGALSALVIGQLVYVAVNFLLIYSKSVRLNRRINAIHLKEVLIGSLPYGILGVLGLLYFRIDSVLLSYLRGPVETGLYGAAYRFLEAIVFVPSAFAAALFPVLSRLDDSNFSEIKKIYHKTLKLFTALAVLLTISYYFILPLVIQWLLPQYEESIPVVKVLALTIPFMFLHIPGAVVLTSTRRYLRPVIYLSIVTLAFNVVANLIFIPKYGLMGASWVTVLSEALSFVVFYLLLYKKILKHG